MIFLNCESTCDLAAVLASIFARKIDARRFDTNHDIIRSISLEQFLPKAEIRLFDASALSEDLFFQDEIIKLVLE